MRPEVARELVRPRTPVDRLRRGATVLASAGIGAALVAAVSVAGLPGGRAGLVDDGGWVVRPQDDPAGDLSPFLAQEGLRPGVVLALVLLVLPFLALALQAVRVGALDLDRRAALLVVAGAAPADLRRLAVRRAAGAFVVGGLLAAPVHLLAWVLLGALRLPGQRLLPVPQWWLVPAWVAVVGLLAVVGALVGLRRATVVPDPVGFSRAPSAPPPLGVVVGTGLAAVVVVLGGVGLLSTASSGGGGSADWATAGLLLLALVLVAAFVASLTSRRAARSPAALPASRGRRLLRVRRGDPAAAVLAAAQRRGDPLAAGTVAGVLVLAGLAVGVAAALSAAFVGPASGLDLGFYVGGAALAGVVAGAGALVALAALALSFTDRLLTARRSVAATAALGTGTGRLVAVQDRALSATAVPAVVVGVLVGGLGYGLLASVVGEGPAGATLGLVAAATLVAALLVRAACRLLAVALAGRVRAAASLENLRVP